MNVEILGQSWKRPGSLQDKAAGETFYEYSKAKMGLASFLN